MTQLFPWSLVLISASVRWIRGQRQDSFAVFFTLVVDYICVFLIRRRTTRRIFAADLSGGSVAGCA